MGGLFCRKEEVNRARQKRFLFIDAVRGAAVLPMIFNHTEHSWLGPEVTSGRDLLSYVTVTTAAPIFLFVAGFSLAVSWSSTARTGEGVAAWRKQSAFRALGLILIGYLLNLVLFRGNFLLLMGPLQTIGFSVLLLIPLVPYLSRIRVAQGMAIFAFVSYAVFAWQIDTLRVLVENHPLLGDTLFFSMPPWPWTSLIFLGVSLGGLWSAHTKDERGKKILRSAALLAAVFLVFGLFAYCFLGWDDYEIHYPGFSTWLPGPATALWITGLPPLVLYLAYRWEKHHVFPSLLLGFGRYALMIYVVHRLFIMTVMARFFHFSVSSWWAFISVNLLLIFALSALGRAADLRRSRVRA